MGREQRQLEPTSDVSIRSLGKTFGDVVAVDDISLEIPCGAFVTILGSSGCGKTTLLRLIGGFEQPDRGDIAIRGEIMANTPPHLRRTSMVFQSYALFPHMTVRENIAFGLRERGIGTQEIAERVQHMLELIDLPHLGDRKPGQLSGGQQQRVALARSLVIEPTVLLLDEPLGALDLMLRRQMQHELKRIQRRLGITFLYVTHDQEEALSMADLVVVMRAGRIEQAGRPEEIFEHPASRFVAEFMGAGNILPTTVETVGDASTVVRFADREVTVPDAIPDVADVSLVIRPERIRFVADDGWVGTVQERVFKGSTLSYRLELNDGTPLIMDTVHGDLDARHDVGDRVRVSFSGNDARLVTR